MHILKFYGGADELFFSEGDLVHPSSCVHGSSSTVRKTHRAMHVRDARLIRKSRIRKSWPACHIRYALSPVAFAAVEPFFSDKA